MIDVTQRRAADAWFLDRGLPAVLRPGALVRRVWPRSAPALAGFAVFMVNSALVVAVTGKHSIDINGHPTWGDEQGSGQKRRDHVTASYPRRALSVHP